MGFTTDARLVAGPLERWFLDVVFTPGTPLGRCAGKDEAVFHRVVEVTEVTTIRVPSGRLIVDTPWPDEYELPLRIPAGRELVERIPPGVHRVEAAWIEGPYEFFGEQYDGREVGATRLCVSDEPVVAWEMGLAVGDDVEKVRPGDRIGFSTETNTGSFADASAWPALAAPFLAFWQQDRDGERRPRATTTLGGGHFEFSSDEAHQADLVALPATEGPNVAWLGRTETGAIASIVIMGGSCEYSEGPSV
ncbi:DUF4241 domain-containing protein [Actinacidiphila acididurans]|uniref:DUF4241 domain-containing protein n=1 Tax=Actinacidiphila acididurans TaxID=2784346 RepID=A0ABS2TVT9_9ACTN|nr:DUF4241 domain-containing protein [Actinacidiphila acididurans]MBM9506405.1 DUF4241 domain-containing protein [Actinacidiphila acididurans]